MIQKLVVLYRGLSTQVRSLFSGARTAITFILGVWCKEYIQSISTKFGLPIALAQVLGLVLIIAIATIISNLVTEVAAALDQEVSERREALGYGASLMDQLVTDDIANEEGALPHHSECADCARARVEAAARRIAAATKALFQLFESRYGESRKIDDRVDFEVTFMTKSYKDKQLTIASWANRNGRRPVSLAMRPGHVDLYDITVAADVYRSPTHDTRLIEDTSKGDAYKELYPGQKSRIRSSIVFPVRSATNVLLGVLVVHCNRAGFFRDTDRRFFEDLLESFAKRIALEKLRMDSVCAMQTRDDALPF